VKILLRIVPAIAIFFWICTAMCSAQSMGERDTDFEIGLSLHAAKPVGVVAHFATTKTYPCEGYTLRTQIRWDRDTVSVYVLGLLRPSPCFQTSAEATGTVFLGDLRGSVWFLRVRYREDVDLYRIVNVNHRLSSFPINCTFTKVNMLDSDSE
jgi:hypothetical protein